MAKETRLAARRKAILAAAEKVFDARGYAAATMDAVAEEAAVAKGSLYNYFESKQELFAQVLAEALSQDEADADELLARDIPAGEKLQHLLDDWFEQLARYKRIGGLVLESWAAAAHERRAGPLAASIRQMHDRWRRRIAGIIERGIERGEFRTDADPVTSASLIMAASDGATVDAILSTGMEINEQFLAAFKQAVLASLAAGSGGRGELRNTP